MKLVLRLRIREGEWRAVCSRKTNLLLWIYRICKTKRILLVWYVLITHRIRCTCRADMEVDWFGLGGEGEKKEEKNWMKSIWFLVDQNRCVLRVLSGYIEEYWRMLSLQGSKEHSDFVLGDLELILYFFISQLRKYWDWMLQRRIRIMDIEL